MSSEDEVVVGKSQSLSAATSKRLIGGSSRSRPGGGGKSSLSAMFAKRAVDDTALRSRPGMGPKRRVITLSNPSIPRSGLHFGGYGTSPSEDIGNDSDASDSGEATSTTEELSADGSDSGGGVDSGEDSAERALREEFSILERKKASLIEYNEEIHGEADLNVMFLNDFEDDDTDVHIRGLPANKHHPFVGGYLTRTRYGVPESPMASRATSPARSTTSSLHGSPTTEGFPSPSKLSSSPSRDVPPPMRVLPGGSSQPDLLSSSLADLEAIAKLDKEAEARTPGTPGTTDTDSPRSTRHRRGRSLGRMDSELHEIRSSMEGRLAAAKADCDRQLTLLLTEWDVASVTRVDLPEEQEFKDRVRDVMTLIRLMRSTPAEELSDNRHVPEDIFDARRQWPAEWPFKDILTRVVLSISRVNRLLHKMDPTETAQAPATIAKASTTSGAKGFDLDGGDDVGSSPSIRKLVFTNGTGESATVEDRTGVDRNVPPMSIADKRRQLAQARGNQLSSSYDDRLSRRGPSDRLVQFSDRVGGEGASGGAAPPAVLGAGTVLGGGRSGAGGAVGSTAAVVGGGGNNNSNAKNTLGVDGTSFAPGSAGSGAGSSVGSSPHRRPNLGISIPPSKTKAAVLVASPDGTLPPQVETSTSTAAAAEVGSVGSVGSGGSGGGGDGSGGSNWPALFKRSGSDHLRDSSDGKSPSPQEGGMLFKMSPEAVDSPIAAQTTPRGLDSSGGGSGKGFKRDSRGSGKDAAGAQGADSGSDDYDSGDTSEDAFGSVPPLRRQHTNPALGSSTASLDTSTKGLSMSSTGSPTIPKLSLGGSFKATKSRSRSHTFTTSEIKKTNSNPPAAVSSSIPNEPLGGMTRAKSSTALPGLISPTSKDVDSKLAQWRRWLSRGRSSTAVADAENEETVTPAGEAQSPSSTRSGKSAEDGDDGTANGTDKTANGTASAGDGSATPRGSALCRICESYIPILDLDAHSKTCAALATDEETVATVDNKLLLLVNGLVKEITKVESGDTQPEVGLTLSAMRLVRDIVRTVFDIDPASYSAAIEKCEHAIEQLAQILAINHVHMLTKDCVKFRKFVDDVMDLIRIKVARLRKTAETASLADPASQHSSRRSARSTRRRDSGVFNSRRIPTIKDFFIINKISAGAYGRVFLAQKKTTGDLFAIKVIRKEDMKRKNQQRYVKNERAILSKINSEFLVTMYYSFQSKRNLYLVMEYLNGGDCLALLKTFGYFEESHARAYVAEMTKALEHLHSQGVIHRDLKPDNLLIDHAGHIRLTDFGLSKFGIIDDAANPEPPKAEAATSTKPTLLTREELAQRQKQDMQNKKSFDIDEYFSDISRPQNTKMSNVGTPDYLAPEIILGSGHSNVVDWWALGVITYEFLTGWPPFTADTVEGVFANILDRAIIWPDEEDMSPVARDFIDKLLCVDPEMRLGVNGAEEVMAHPFFDGVEWDQILKKNGPFVPKPAHTFDLSYHDDRSNSAEYTEPELRSEGVPSPLTPNFPDGVRIHSNDGLNLTQKSAMSDSESSTSDDGNYLEDFDTANTTALARVNRVITREPSPSDSPNISRAPSTPHSPRRPHSRSNSVVDARDVSKILLEKTASQLLAEEASWDDS